MPDRIKSHDTRKKHAFYFAELSRLNRVVNLAQSYVFVTLIIALQSYRDQPENLGKSKKTFNFYKHI